MVAAFVVAYLRTHMEPAQMPDVCECFRLAGVGFVLFFLGFVFFFNATDYDFSTAGIANRVVIASALGTGCITVAAQLYTLVPGEGLEPPRPCGLRILSPINAMFARNCTKLQLNAK